MLPGGDFPISAVHPMEKHSDRVRDTAFVCDV